MPEARHISAEIEATNHEERYLRLKFRVLARIVGRNGGLFRTQFGGKWLNVKEVGPFPLK